MELLKRLNDSFSASGYEDEIRAVVCDYLSSCYEVSVDALGNVIATKTGVGEHFVFLAPMDTGGYFLNCMKDDKSSYYVNLVPGGKTNPNGAEGRTFDGKLGTFFHDPDHPEQSYFASTHDFSLPVIADVSVSFSVSKERVRSRQVALYTLLCLAEKLFKTSASVTFVALAQTTLNQRGIYGQLPSNADLYLLIESMENDKFHLGDGGVCCLKDGTYICPQQIKERLSAFSNYYVGEEKPSLANTLAKQNGGCLVASLKIPVLGIGTVNETFCPSDVEDLCDKLLELV